MESIAAERLNKIGKNPSIVCPREDFQSELKAVSELLTMSAQSPSEDSESDISIFNKNQSKNKLKLNTKLPRPKSESCFPLVSALSITNFDNKYHDPNKQLNQTSQEEFTNLFKRSSSLFKSRTTGTGTGTVTINENDKKRNQELNQSTSITVTAPSSTSLNKP